MIETASGRYERPALIALKPSTFCMYSEMKKNMENSEAPVRSPTTLAPVRVRRRKIENGTSGDFARLSIATKAPSSATEAASSTIVCVDPHPTSGASTSA